MNSLPYLIDTTLRDGEQTPGIRFSHTEKMKIAEMLEQLGVDEVEVGTPAMGAHECNTIKAIATAGFNYATSCWCRARKKEILVAAKLNTDSINISLPVSDIQIEALSKNRKWVMSQLKETISLATNYFPHITVGAQDASRANKAFLYEYIQAAQEFGAGRVRIADTVGMYDPQDVFNLIQDIKYKFQDIRIEFHGHNDLGMATANTIAAVNAQADCISATLNGIGERAGNASLEEIIATLVVKTKTKRFNTAIIHTLCNYIASISGLQYASNKPIIGSNVYTHESGIHVAAMLKSTQTYQILNPVDFGCNNTSYVLGKHTGHNALDYFMQQNGIHLNPYQMNAMLQQLKNDKLMQSN